MDTPSLGAGSFISEIIFLQCKDSFMTTLTIALLVVCGFILLVIEVLLIPGFSIPGILGIGMIIYGVWRARVAYGFEGALVTMLLCAVGAVVLILFALKSRTVRSVGLEYDEKGHSSIDDYTALVGKEGTALTKLRPAGIATIEGNRIDVVTDGEFIEANSPIRVAGIEGARIIVELKEGG
ncbi:MAG: NfeD family protein [Candidatus Latescibacterota bacterium]